MTKGLAVAALCVTATTFALGAQRGQAPAPQAPPHVTTGPHLAVIDASHRPDWMSVDIAPHWFTLGCAAYNLYLSLLCYMVQRR